MGRAARRASAHCIKGVSHRSRRLLVVALAALFVALGSVGAIAVAEPDGGPGHAVLDWAEDRVRQNETLHYGMHRALGYGFGLCPCTDRLSRSQHAKAALHRPQRESPERALP